MVNREELKGRWDIVKNRLLNHWRELSDTELAHFNGTPNQLISAIQRKTGASWKEVESFLANVMRESRATSQRASDLAEQSSDEVSRFARDGYQQLTEATEQYSRKVARTVQRRPIESLAIAFGVGIISGAVVLLSRRR